MESIFRNEELPSFKNYTNPNYWMDLAKFHEKDKNKLYKLRLECSQIVEKQGLDSTKKLVEDLLWEKFDKLTDCYNDSLYKVA